MAELVPRALWSATSSRHLSCGSRTDCRGEGRCSHRSVFHTPLTAGPTCDRHTCTAAFYQWTRRRTICWTKMHQCCVHSHQPAVVREVLYTFPPVGRALWTFFPHTHKGVCVGMDVQIWKTHFISPQLCCIWTQTAASPCNYQSIKLLIQSRRGSKMWRERPEKRLHNVEHRGVTLLLLYRAAACSASLLWACSILVTLMRWNSKRNHRECVNTGHNTERCWE